MRKLPIIFALLFLALPAHAQVLETSSGNAVLVTSSGAPLLPTAGFSLNFMSGTLPTGVTLARASSGTYFNSSGVLSTASSNVARFDYNPSTLALRGILIEPQATNLLTYSNDWTQTNFTRSITVTANSVSSPDGTTDGNTATITGGSPLIRKVATTASGTGYTFSLYGKSDGGFHPQISMFSDADGYIYGPTDYFSQLSTTTWTRVAVSGTANYTSEYAAPIDNAGGTGSLYIFGAQCETGTVATSYIPTTSSTATRAADQMSFTIPSGIGHVTYTFDDNSTQTIAVSAGAYTVPTNLNRPWIETIVGST